MKRPIVVGVTFGQNPDVLGFAIEEAHRSGQPLRIVHVADDPLVSEALFDELLQAPDGRLGEEPVDFVTASSDPIDVLLAEAAEADLMVLGADNTSLTSRVSWTGIARQVALRAQCTVVVVPRERAVRGRAGGVAVAIDDSRPMETQLAYAFQAASARHAGPEVVYGAGEASDYPGRQTHLGRIDDVLDPWRSAYPAVQVQVSVEGGHPVGACLEAGTRASLLVVGRPEGSHPRVGSRAVASRILRHSTAPVAIVSPDQDVVRRPVTSRPATV